MNNKSLGINLLVLIVIGIGCAIGFIYFKSESSPTNELHSHEAHDHSTDFKRGPHSGRLLEEGKFQIEITIFEPEGVPPKFRIYFYDNGSPINPAEVQYQMELQRINRTENIPFRQYGDYIESTVEAKEPHSFKVKVLAVYKGKTYEWEYETYEGRVELSKETVQANSIKIEKAQPAVLEIALNVMGKIMPNEEATVYISPRFPGVVKAVYKKLGDSVKKGETLAVIESNESLKNYDLKSEIDGTVIKRDINLGMYLSGQENVFVISNLKTVWADFNVYRHDLPQVKVGNLVQVSSLDGNLKQESAISYISPLGDGNTQSVVARAILENPNEVWKPGLFISGNIIVDAISVDVAIKDAALQTFRDWSVVFLSSGDVFEVVPVELGRRNKEWVEIKSGLSEGDSYVSDNSYILKADLEKSGATHEH